MKGRRVTSKTPKLVLSAGIVPVHLGAEPLYLLLRAYRYWDFPKGVVEEGESPLPGALRELREETGISRVDFRWGEGYLETEPYSYGKVARYYVGLVPSRDVSLEANPATGEHEHEEYRWVNYLDARALLVPRVQTVLQWAHSLVQSKK